MEDKNELTPEPPRPDKESKPDPKRPKITSSTTDAASQIPSHDASIAQAKDLPWWREQISAAIEKLCKGFHGDFGELSNDEVFEGYGSRLTAAGRETTSIPPTERTVSLFEKHALTPEREDTLFDEAGNYALYGYQDGEEWVPYFGSSTLGGMIFRFVRHRGDAASENTIFAIGRESFQRVEISIIAQFNVNIYHSFMLSVRKFHIFDFRPLFTPSTAAPERMKSGYAHAPPSLAPETLH